MVGFLDSQVIEKFKEFQKHTGKYSDLAIDEVEFEKIALSNKKYFQFIKGKNKYIQEYISKNQGEYPILGSSLKNDCIANYIIPIDVNDIVNQTCVSFNKDNAKGSLPFYRDYPFLMDRHHIAILPTDKISPMYLYHSLRYHFDKSNFGWGENVASVEEVQKHAIPIPHDLNEKYTSYLIQKAIVEFLEYSFNYIERIKTNINKHSDIVNRMKKSLVPSTFIRTAIKDRFKKYAIENNINFDITDILFEEANGYIYGDFFEFQGGNSEYKKNYYTNIANKGDYPLFTGSTNIVEYIQAINANDIYGAPSISYNKDNDKGSKAFFHDEPYIVGGHHYALKLKNEFIKDIHLKYSYYLLVNHFSKTMYFQSQEPRANSGIIKQVEFLKPVALKNYSSYELQKILSDFMDSIMYEIEEKYLNNINKAYEVVEELRKTYLARTFSLIDWRVKDNG